MFTNKKLTSLLIFIGIGNLVGAVIGFIAGTYDPPIGVTLGIIVPTVVFIFVLLSRRKQSQ